MMHLPFFFYTLGIWHIIRYISKENVCDQITESIIIGRRLLQKECPEEIMNYVDLTAEFTEPKPLVEGMNYIFLPILDTGIPNIDEFDKALNKVTNEMTYIHCAQGHGRTAIFTIALLVRIGKLRNFEEAFDLLKKSRTAIDLNTRQRIFVQEYLKKHA
jgi:protein-tyrosine phosphatase